MTRLDPMASFSFEFFPAKTPEGAVKLRDVSQQLAVLSPNFFSVTFGAGGSTQAGTLSTVQDLQAAGLSVAPHLSCIGSTRDGILELLNTYRGLGVARIVALRGDLPSGMGQAGEFRYANELIEFIRAETGDHFHLEVAGYPEFHPQARSAEDDLNAFARKVAAGANSAITQYFFNADAYFAFAEAARKRGVMVPIVPGIMPISNFSQLQRFSDVCGAEIPRWLRLKMGGFGDDVASIRAYGLDVVTNLCERLLAGGAPGLHFYTLNQSALSLELWQRLRLSERR